MRKTCAFIFARGGSKGLPRKNILNIGGAPMLVHGIRLAQELDNVEAIYVSTDCSEISEVAVNAGAEVIPRPLELSGDNSPEWIAWQHAIKHVQDRRGYFDNFLSLPPTAPLRSLEDVQNCIAALTPDVDIVVTMSPARRSPWFNMVRRDIDGSVKILIHDNSVIRRQDSPECFDLTTVAYAAKTNFILSSESIWDGRVAGVDIPVERSLDIDTSFDFDIAQYVMEKRSHRH